MKRTEERVETPQDTNLAEFNEVIANSISPTPVALSGRSLLSAEPTKKPVLSAPKLSAPKLTANRPAIASSKPVLTSSKPVLTSSKPVIASSKPVIAEERRRQRSRETSQALRLLWKLQAIRENLAYWTEPMDLQAFAHALGEERLQHKSPGVYIIGESHPGLSRRSHSFYPRYIGESEDVSRRLAGYARGFKGKGFNPVIQVTEDHLAQASAHERRLYERLSDPEQLAWRKSWMDERNLRVIVAHTRTKEEAVILEEILISHYRGAGHVWPELWNKKEYRTTVPFRASVVAR